MAQRPLTGSKFTPPVFRGLAITITGRGFHSDVLFLCNLDSNMNLWASKVRDCRAAPDEQKKS